MNLKSTLKTSLLFRTLLNGKIICTHKSLPFFMVAFFVVSSFNPLKAFSKSSERLTFSAETVKSFNAKVTHDLRSTFATIAAPCPEGSGVIGGKAFQDFNYNGLDDQIGGGIAGIEVYLYACDASGNSSAAGSTTTDADGTYFFDGLTDGATYRVEFIAPASMNFLQSGFNGADSRTTVQFVNSPSCDANIGLTSPANFCEADPSLAIPCYVNGDPLAAGSGSAAVEALVLFKSSYEGGTPEPTLLATAEEIGATWGIAYHKATKTIYTSAFLKRHAGFGPLGIGGIYKTDLSGDQAVTSPFIDVNSIGINVGSYPSNSERGLTANINLPNNDPQAYDEVGKKGLGGMCMSADGSTLYVVNITEKKLHSINISNGVPTSGDVVSFNIPNPNCSGGEFRPFAVRTNNGKIYVGGVCDAEGSGNKSDLRSIVYRLDGNNFTEVLNFSLDYTKGAASRSCADGGWFPWTNQLPETCFMSGDVQIIVHPTPHLTALEFDEAGDLILGFTDRMGNQLGFINYAPTGTDSTYSVFTGGDILKAGANQDGSFTIENNGSVNGKTTSGADNGEGPGGGEFYSWDIYEIAPNVPKPHSETAQGGLASIKGSGQIISTALDPFGTSVNAGGVNYFDNQTGEVRDPGYRVFRSGSSSPASFSKANGLGDLVALCGEAPIEIGGRLWLDANKNGIQDPCEQPFSGVDVALYAMDGQVKEVVTSDANGEYYFNGSSATVTDIESNTDYYIVIGFGSQFDEVNNVLLDSFFLTTPNTGMGQNPDLNDSDGMTTPGGILAGAFEGWPSIMITTGNVGEVTHDNDVGFFIDVTKPKANITGFVWNDLNENGLQDNGELGIPGVTVSLFDSNNTFIASTSTDASGNYIFENIEGDNYYLVFDASGNAMAGDNFEVTLQDIGSDEHLDSDISQSDSRVDFEFEPANGDAEFDAGFTLPVAQIVGLIFNDADEDGLQGDNETGIGGVTVTLFNEDGTEVATTTSDANGNYTFDNIMEGDFYIVVDVSTNTVGVPNFEGTQQDAGEDNFDSDVNPSTGQSDVFSHDPAVGNSDIDAGFTLPSANIMGIAFNDVNENGLQDENEPMIGGVTVTLFDSNNNQINSTTTDANGNYIFNEIMTGNYYIVFDVSTNTATIENYLGTIQDAGEDDFDSDADPNTGRTTTFNFNPSDGNDIYDAGYFVGTGVITGRVFNDLNKNGLQDPGDPGIGNVKVTVIAPDGTPISTYTNEDGTFSVEGVPSGIVTVLFDPEDNSIGIENLTPAEKDVNNNQNDDIDSDINPNKEVDLFKFNAVVGADVDAGFCGSVQPAMIGDFVFKDCNENGIQDPDEKGVPNIPVTLRGTNDLGAAIEMQMTTNSMGAYLFTVLRPGTYFLDFDIPDGVTGLEFSPKNRGNSVNDSDVNPLSGVTDAITLASGESNLTIDAGVLDNAPPLIFNIPPDVTVDCNDIPNLPSSLKGVDNCDPSVEIIFSESIINAGACPYMIERTWRAVDDCGNETIRTQTITVTDTEAPVITIANPMLVGIENGGELTFNCDNLPEFTADDVNVTDNCSDVEVKFVDLIREQGDCEVDGFIVKMTCGWVAEDNCGNRSEFNIVIFVVDTKSPVLQNIPADLTINLDAGQFIPPVPNTVTATDNCDEYVKIEFEETQSAGVCGYEIIRTWKAFDDCGNKTVESQRLTLLEDCTCPDELVSNTLVWDVACDGSEGGKIILDLTADINKYDITITPNVGNVNFSGNMFTDLPPGDYTVTVNYDAIEDCKETYNFTITTATPSTIEVVSQTTADCNTANGTVTLAPASNTYAWSDGGTGAQRNDLAAGAYRVTFTDVNNCQGAQAINIINPDDCACIDFSVNLLWEIMPTCNGYTNGQVDVEIIGGTAPYTYLWHDGQITKDLFGVAGGPYSLTATDANGCTATLTGELEQPDAISVTETLMNVACGKKGAIDIFVSGGTAPYTYLWSGGETTEDLTNLTTGTYTITVTDANSCEGNLTVNISNSGDISIDLSSTNPTCANETNGSITAMVMGGQNPLTYQWSNGATTSSIENIIAGTYAVMVTDATGCSAMAELTLAAATALSASFITTDQDCSGDGNIDLTVSGGTAPYTYSWSNGSVEQNLTDITAGTYSVTVADANGCQVIASASIDNIANISVSVDDSVNPTCAGNTDGFIKLSISGGTMPYTYAWTNGATTEDINGLAAGVYAVTVSDAGGCKIVLDAFLEAPAAISMEVKAENPACPGGTGNINVTVMGGTLPYSYAWSNGATTENVTDLPAAQYTVVVTDANGCSLEGSATIQPATEILASTVVTNQSCTTGDGAIDLTISGGSGTYSYLWNNGAITQDLSGLTSGNYEVTITDTKGCVITEHIIIGDNCVCPSPLVNQNMVTDAKCGAANGSIMIIVNGDINQYQFQWTPNIGTIGVNQNERTNLPAGTYDVKVSYANKAECTEILRLIVGNKDGVSGSIYSNVPATCDENNGKIVLTPGVTYLWPDGSSSQNRNDLAPGAYTIKTVDPSGCESALIVTVTQETCEIICMMEATAVIKNPDCEGNSGRVDVNVTGGTAPYTYEWNNTTIGNTQDPNSLEEGDYLIVITDANGCKVTLMATLTKPDCTPSPCNISLSLQTTNLTCDGANDGSIHANILNGTGPYTYKWSNGATTESINNLSPGEYWVEVIDSSTGCRVNTTIRVESPGRLVISETRTVLDCQGVEIKLNVSGGRAPYKWECQSNTGSLLDPLNLTPGTYNCVVTDGSGCSVNYELVIEDYQPLDVTGVVKNATCGQEDGSIDLTVTGGTAPYTFDWDCGLFHDEDQFNLGPHTYNVTVTDATDCVVLGTYTIEDCSGEGFGFIAVDAVSLGNQSVQLTWETANENRVGNYVVYHSTDGKNFDVIGQVMEGKGPAETANYEMEELGRFGKNYYQIKYLDLVGNKYFSEIVDVVVFLDESTGRTSIPAIVYPNPTYDEFVLDFAKPIEAVIKVMITDMDGVVIEEIELQPGTTKHIFDSYKYDTGVYNITVQQRRKKLSTYRLIKATE